MWSIGCILYVLLTGFPPFGGHTDAETLAKVSLGKYSLQELEEEEVSEECLDLLKRLLTLDPDERISAAEALEHPWILMHRDTVKNMPIAMNALNQVKDFKTGKRIQQAAI